jgi:hypothetical protein
MVTLNAIYTNWTSASGALLFPTFEPGSEFGWAGTVNGIPFGPARESLQFGIADMGYTNIQSADYFSYQVLNKTSIL